MRMPNLLSRPTSKPELLLWRILPKSVILSFGISILINIPNPEVCVILSWLIIASFIFSPIQKLFVVPSILKVILLSAEMIQTAIPIGIVQVNSKKCEMTRECYYGLRKCSCWALWSKTDSGLITNIIDVNLNWENYWIEWCLDNKDNVLQIYISFLWGLQAYYP